MVNTCVLYRQFLQFLKTYSIIVIMIITAITITITVVIFIINFIMHILLIIIIRSSRVGYVKHIYPVIFLVIH